MCDEESAKKRPTWKFVSISKWIQPPQYLSGSGGMWVTNDLFYIPKGITTNKAQIKKNL